MPRSRPKLRWEDNIKMDPTAIRRDSVETRYRNCWLFQILGISLLPVEVASFQEGLRTNEVVNNNKHSKYTKQGC